MLVLLRGMRLNFHGGLMVTSDTSHRTVITLDTVDKLSENERNLIDLQIRWICETQLIPITDLTIEES